MNQDQERRLFELFSALAEDRITEDEHAELQDILRKDAEARQLWFEFQDLEAGLRLIPAQEEEFSRSSGWRGWFSTRPWAIAAAGVMFGVFAASSLWALSLHRNLTHSPLRCFLMGESFESSSLEIGNEFPSVPGQWGGESPTKVVGPESGVSPLEGSRMLKLNPSETTLNSRAFYVVDLDTIPGSERSHPIELKGYFHETEAATRTRIMMRAALYCDELEDFDEEWMKQGWSEIGDHAVSQATRAFNLDPQATGWQEMIVTLQASAEARYLIVMVGGFSVNKDHEKGQSKMLPFYFDDLRASCLAR